MTAPRLASPYLTADIPGIGGLLKQQPDDFIVEEISDYHPCGSGEHLFLWIEKRDVSAEQLSRHLARALGIQTNDIGVAGLKDRRAISRQYVSVPASCEQRLPQVETNGITVLRSARHRNKLKTGHLKGNRFEVVVRNVPRDALQRAQRIAQALQRGFPNLYGDQRFGVGDETLRLGVDLLTGARTAADIPRKRRRFLLRLSLSSVQSALFNEVLIRRMEDDLLHQVMQGDVMQVIASRGVFVVEDVALEQPRFDTGETAVTGPMFGPEMKCPTGVVSDREASVLAAHQLTMQQIAQWRRLMPGTRRPLVVRWLHFDLQPVDDGLRFVFELPRGTYATTLLREFQKADLDDAF